MASNSSSDGQFNSAAGLFSEWAKDSLFQAEHTVGNRILDEAVDIHLIGLYRELNLHSMLAEHSDSVSLCEALDFNDSAHVAVEHFLRRLADRHDFLDCDASTTPVTFKPVAQPEDLSEGLPALEKEMSELGSDYEAPLEFLDYGATHFVRTMRDEHDFMDRVLTGQIKEHEETWHRATNTDPLQDIHGIMGGKAVDLLFEGGTILEVGGGTGNGLRNNMPALEASGKIEKLENYIFTDVSMPFILNTRKELKSAIRTEKCEWRLLNINKDFQKQRIEADSVDLIYGVNAAHIAKHTVEFMQQCITALKPGGLIVFSERIRRTAHEMAPREIVLNQSLYHRTAAIRDPDFRPAHAYLAREHWLKACELAGFVEYEVWPGVDELSDYFPEQYAVVLVARAPSA